jgi:hypothetical protein
LRYENLLGGGKKGKGKGFRMKGKRFRMKGKGFRMKGKGFRMKGKRFWMKGKGFRMKGKGFREGGFAHNYMILTLKDSTDQLVTVVQSTHYTLGDCDRKAMKRGIF